MKAWLEENTEIPECLGYEEMTTSVKRDLKNALLLEQGYICGYTGLEVEESTSHLEHVKPYSDCKNEDGKHTLESYDYFNLIACFPKLNSDIKDLKPKPKNLDFGAVHREDKTENFLSPFTEDCETRFRFDLYGEISAANHGDVEAVETIKILGLDSKNLTPIRKAAIHSQLGLDDVVISEDQMLKILEVIDEPDSDGKLKAFCFAIKQAIQFYLYGEVA